MPDEVESSKKNPYRRFRTFMWVAIGLIALFHVYLAHCLIAGAGLQGLPAWVGWGTMAMLFGLLPFGMRLSGKLESRLNFAVYLTAMIWLGGFAFFFSLAVLTDVAKLILSFVYPEASQTARLSWNHGQGAIILGGGALALLSAYLTARSKARVERVEIPLSKLGKAMDGLRIVQISDVHIGPTLRKAFLHRLVQEVNALKPDIIAVTGDLIDSEVMALRPQLAPLSELKAPLGAYFVMGNHEFYHGGTLCEDVVREHGLIVLHNEHRVVSRGNDSLVLAGVTDHDGARFGPSNASRPDLAFEGAPEGIPWVLLAHQPRSASAAAKAGADLQLSGHTHGGQFFPWMFFVRLQQPMLSGLKRLHGIWVYTNRGAGYWGPPLRLGPTPEISELILRCTP